MQYNYQNIRSYITHIKANYGRESAILNLIELKFLRVHPSMKSHILLYSNSLAIWHGFPDITHIRDNNSRKFSIFYFIELKFICAISGYCMVK